MVMAIPDHPWTKATEDAAAVRIAMTVGEAGAEEGVLREVVRETALNTDTPQVEFVETLGVIHSDLTIGADITTAKAFKANEGMFSWRQTTWRAGFIVTRPEAEHLGLGKRPGLEATSESTEMAEI